MVGLSFVREPDDVESLIAALEACGRPDLGMVLKIETVPAFRNFPALLLTAMTRPGPVGVMVARGDMGVELGFERTSEVQEELLWLCEAAHTPLIWATQVLESLTKKGLPTRAEITDAAKGARAECVMLNRGARVEDALTMLVDILGRMEQHQQKKLQLFRELSVSRGIDLP
jgi:pyruvate kinase